MAKIIDYFNQAINFFNRDSIDRLKEKANFIESRMAILRNQHDTMNGEEIENRLRNLTSYSTQGVFNALSFDPEPKFNKLIAEQFNSSYDAFGLDTAEINFSQNPKDRVRSFFDEKNDLKIALTITPDGNVTTRPYTDLNEINDYMIDQAADYVKHLFHNSDLKANELYESLKGLYPNKDILLEKVAKSVDYDLSKVNGKLQEDYNLETQLDKLVRAHEKSHTKIGNVEISIMARLKDDGLLAGYLNSRLGTRSLMSDFCKEQLILAEEKVVDFIKSFKKPSLEQSALVTDEVTQDMQPQQSIDENYITFAETSKSFITTLSQKHETLFKKVEIKTEKGISHYWANSDETVKIISDRVSVNKVNESSVQLALDAAIHSFGNTLTIKGSDEFKDKLLDSLVNNKEYSQIKLTNSDLQAKLDQLRDIDKSLETENFITGNDVVLNKVNDGEYQGHMLVSQTHGTKIDINSREDIFNYFSQVNPEAINKIKEAGIIEGKDIHINAEDATPSQLVSCLSEITRVTAQIGRPEDVLLELPNGQEITYQGFNSSINYKDLASKVSGQEAYKDVGLAI